mmetsp:Transcript_27908/g.67622  ORF Transcript_27908/g.67622 Transcript_27908/m.67622 type:complete len:319 (-) Transcript_27908:4318-5274(-)
MKMNLHNNNNMYHAPRKTHDASIVMTSLLIVLFLCFFCHVGQVASFNSANVQVVGPGPGGMRSINSIRSTTTAGSSPRSQRSQQQQLQQLQRSRRRITSENTFVLYDSNSKSKDITNEEDTKEKAEEEEEMDLLTKSSWYAVEWFGKAFGSNNKNKDNGVNKSSGIVDTTQLPKSITETLKRIQLDNDNAYFLNGQMDTLIYDADCVFADPFVSFEGRDRFVDNLSNLGSFITKYDCKVLRNNDSEENEDPATITTTTRFMVKLELNLPWRPILAWPWGVTYEIDPETFLVKKHTESWEIQPWEGVQQIFRKPTTTIQ